MWRSNVAFNPDGKTLAMGGDEGVLKLWNAATGKEPRAMAIDPEGRRRVRSLDFSLDGGTLAVGAKGVRQRE